MAHRRSKLEAVKLFDENFWPPEVSDTLHINLRTVQRWFAEWRSNSQKNVVEPENLEYIVSAAVESVEIINKAPHLGAVTKSSGNWYEAATELAEELLRDHGRIRRKLTELLTSQLDKPELNIRLLQGLSQSVVRHSEIEIGVASLSLLDINRAFKTVENEGYIVIDPNYVNDK